MKSRGLEEVVILNVDTNTLETPFDDLKRIPSDVVINVLVCVCCMSDSFTAKCEYYNVTVFQFFLR